MARKAGSEYWEKPKNVHPAYTEMPPEVVCGAVVERLGLDSRAVQIDGQHWKLETLAQLHAEFEAELQNHQIRQPFPQKILPKKVRNLIG